MRIFRLDQYLHFYKFLFIFSIMSTPHNEFKHASYHQYGYPSPYSQPPRPDLLNQNSTAKSAAPPSNATLANFNANTSRSSRAGATPTLNQLLQTSNMDPRYAQNSFPPGKGGDIMNSGQPYPNPAWNNMPRAIPPHMQYRPPVSYDNIVFPLHT